MKKPTPPKPESEPHCCEKPTLLIPVLVTATAVIIAVVLICMSFQQRAISTQRQTIRNLKCDIEVLQHELWVAEAGKTKSVKDLDKNSFWVEMIVHCPTGFTNHMEYPPRFLLKD